jgi:predicted phosphodiesterase
MTRTALLADIHGNSPALRAVLKDIEQEGCTRWFVLGDIINGHDPAGCVDLLQSRPEYIQALKGNAENYLLTPELETFPKSHESFYPDLIRLLRWYEQRLSPAQLSWLSGLPDIIRWNGACLAHDSPLDRLFAAQRFIPGIDPKYQELIFHSPGIYPETTGEQLQQVLNWMASDSVSQVYIGHTHVPFIAWHGSRLLCNVGSVGAPLDGDPHPTWVLVEQSPGELPVVTIRRVEYEIDEILEMADANADYPDFNQPGMQRAYKMMLQTGIHWRVHFNEANL